MNMKEASAADPVYGDDETGWYFYDETWSDSHGPYKDEAEARKHLKQYVQNLEEGSDPAADRDFTPPYEP